MELAEEFEFLFKKRSFFFLKVSFWGVGLLSLTELVLFVMIHSNGLGDEDMHLALAHQNYKAGNYNQALDHSNAIYRKNPKRTDNLLLLGAIYYQVIHCFTLYVPISFTS